MPAIELNHSGLEDRWLYCDGSPELLFTENETNAQRLWGAENPTPYVKDGINDFIVHGAKHSVNPEHFGTKAAAHYELTVEAGNSTVLRLRLTDQKQNAKSAFESFDRVFRLRKEEADDFYATVIPGGLSSDSQNVMCQEILRQEVQQPSAVLA